MSEHYDLGVASAVVFASKGRVHPQESLADVALFVAYKVSFSFDVVVKRWLSLHVLLA